MIPVPITKPTQKHNELYTSYPRPKIDSSVTSLLWAGLIAALLWSVADILLVGFVAETQHYPLFNTLLNDPMASDLAILMLNGSPQRLLWGVLFATFSVVLYLFSAFGVYRLIKRSQLSLIIFILLLSGYALSPLAHAGFFYLGISAQSFLHSDTAMLKAQIAQFTLFYTVLKIHWLASVGLSAIAWFLVLFQTLTRHTVLPRHAALLNPFPLALIIAFTCSFFPTSFIAVAAGGASFNLAQLIFFGSALIYLRQDGATLMRT